jgi:hypothetical protein
MIRNFLVLLVNAAVAAELCANTQPVETRDGVVYFASIPATMFVSQSVASKFSLRTWSILLVCVCNL